ncbi:MAG TPA: HEAT repeat domain-containing protein, partial [Pirellulales bacterium]
HMETLSPAGATFRSRPWKEGVEWLASPEEWFRPVSLAQAPDGSLLLVDMYRAVIEHPEFMPPELKNRPDLMLGAERGRIWRIAPQDDAPASQQLALDKLTTPELVEQLAHANGWRRTTAQRLLMAAASSDKANVKNAVAPALIAFAESTKSSEGLTHAGWLLSWLSDGKLDQNNTAIAQRTLRHSDPRVRENAARMWQAALPESPALVEEYRTLAGDADAGVRFQVALALGNLNRDEVTPVLAKIAARDAADRWTRLAVASSSGGRTGKLVAALLADAPGFSGDARPERVRFVQELSELIGSAREPAEVGAVIDALTNRDAVWLRAGLIGLSEGVSRRGASFSAFLATLPGGADRAITALTDATKPAIDPQASPDDRLAAVRLLGHSSWGAAGTALKRLLADEETSFELALAAVQALAAHPQSEVAVALLGKWPAATPALRGAVLDALLRRGEWTTALLDAIESGAVRPGDVDPTRARRLIASTDASIAGRAKSLLRDSLPADRAGVLERYRAALALPADLDRGREVFRKNCAACHSVAGIGTNVGPDVSDTRTKTPEMLLTDVLNPNAAIDGNFISYNVSTRDGRVRTGLIASESASGLVLKRENQQSDVILRADVEEVWSSGMSLMPEGLEKALSVQDAADVIHFLKRWRFADGSVPAGK